MQQEEQHRSGAANTKRIEYTCPMHPEVRQAEPGKCPKCGMNLEKRAAPDAGARK